MPYCSIKWCGKCSATSSYTKDGITFHKFPKNPARKEVWIEACHRDHFFPTKYSVICSRHFTPNCFENLKNRRRLFISALPTLYLPSLIPPADSINNQDPPSLSTDNESSQTMEPTTSSLRVCRGCLATGVRLYDMRRNQLLEAYTRLVQVTDILPHYLCSYCAVLLLKCDSFRIKCVDALFAFRYGQLDNQSTKHIEQINRQTNKLTLPYKIANPLIINIDPVDKKDNDSLNSKIDIKKEDALNSGPDIKHEEEDLNSDTDIKHEEEDLNSDPDIKYEEEDSINSEPEINYEISRTEHNNPLLDDKSILKDYLVSVKHFDSSSNTPDMFPQKSCPNVINKKDKITNKKQFKPRKNNSTLKDLELLNKESNCKTNIKNQNNEAAKERDLEREITSDYDNDITDIGPNSVVYN